MNSARYGGVLQPVDLPFIPALRSPTFQQDNARQHVVGILRTFLDGENVRLLTWPARSQDLSPIENSGPWLPSTWIVTIRQSLRLMSCGIVMKLHDHLHLYMPSDLCLNQCPSV
ncbi:transposable element Tcb1 transposase [Trichonephila clavipes]|nr:transposable element Tcb1 transposase [Trichonephila clavipes]